MQKFFITIIPTLIDTTTPASPHHWRSTSSPEENNFIHWLHLILQSTVERVCRGGQQASYSFLQASSQQSKKHLFSLWKKREELGSGQLLHKEGNHRNLQVLSGTGEGDGGVKDLSNRGEPLRIFRVITSGSEAVAYICNYHVHLSIDEGLLIVTLDVFC